MEFRDIIIRITYTGVFLGIVLLDYLRIKKASHSSSEEAQEFKVNILTGLFLSLGGFVLNPISIFLYRKVYDFRITHFPSGLIGFVLALLLLDFLYYWNHRFNHQWSFLWKAHRIHHEGRFMNLSLGPRQSIWQSLYSIPFFLPMAWLGVTYETVILASLVSMCHQLWTHYNWSGGWELLDGLIVFPKDHRIHHGSEEVFFDRNFGGIFIFWDRIFCTYKKDATPDSLGFPAESRSVFHERASAFRPLPIFSVATKAKTKAKVK